MALREQLQWLPSDALSVRLLAGTMQEDDDSTTPDVYIDPGSTAALAGGILRTFGLAETCASNDSLDHEHCSRTPNTSEVDAHEATLLVDYTLGNDWTVTSITSWDWFKFEGTSDDMVQLAAPLLKFHDTQEGESWQQELRLASAGGETVDWLAGVFWYQNEFERGDDGDRAIFLEVPTAVTRFPLRCCSGCSAHRSRYPSRPRARTACSTRKRFCLWLQG